MDKTVWKWEKTWEISWKFSARHCLFSFKLLCRSPMLEAVVHRAVVHDQSGCLSGRAKLSQILPEKVGCRTAIDDIPSKYATKNFRRTTFGAAQHENLNFAPARSPEQSRRAGRSGSPQFVTTQAPGSHRKSFLRTMTHKPRLFIAGRRLRGKKATYVVHCRSSPRRRGRSAALDFRSRTGRLDLAMPSNIRQRTSGSRRLLSMLTIGEPCASVMPCGLL